MIEYSTKAGSMSHNRQGMRSNPALAKVKENVCSNVLSSAIISPLQLLIKLYGIGPLLRKSKAGADIINKF